MTIGQGRTPVHWTYLLALESDVLTLSRYVEFSAKNWKAYSLEMAHIFLAASSEVDVVAKILCNRVTGSNKEDNINEYRKTLDPHYTNIRRFKLTMPRYGLQFTPWTNWRRQRNPDWWTAHNKVKHERNLHFEKANLQNVLNAVAGLHVLVLYLYAEEARNAELTPPSMLFMPDAEFLQGFDPIGTGSAIAYGL